MKTKLTQRGDLALSRSAKARAQPQYLCSSQYRSGDGGFEGVADKLVSGSVRCQWPVCDALRPLATKLPISGGGSHGRIAMRTGGNFEMRMPGKFQMRKGGKVDANMHLAASRRVGHDKSTLLALGRWPFSSFVRRRGAW